MVAGHRYRTGHRIVGRQMIEVDAVDVIDPARITKADARRAGFPDADALRAELRGDADAAGVPDPPSTWSTSPTRGRVLAASADLSAADRDEIDRRLARLDRASKIGPWTRAVLA